MATLETLVVRLVGDTSEFATAMNSGAKQAKTGADKIKDNIKSTISTIANLEAGAMVMAGTFKKAFDFAEEGAQILFTQDKLDNLAVSIGTTSDAIINRLGEATRGLMSDAEIVSSATEIISLGLGDNEESVVRLATVVGKLGWDMQQVILTFANNSKMRLDALGLSVEVVDAKTEKFIAQGYSMDKAFDLAVLEAGEEKIGLLGDAADSAVAPFTRLETKVQNITDNFKVWLAEGLVPWLELMEGGSLNINDALSRHSDEVFSSSESWSDYAKEVMRAQQAAGRNVQLTEDNRLVMVGFHGQLLDVTEQFGLLSEAEWIHSRVIEDDRRAVYDFGQEVQAAARAQQDAAEVAAFHAAAANEWTVEHQQLAAAMEDDRREMYDWSETIAAVAEVEAARLAEIDAAHTEFVNNMATVGKSAFESQIGFVDDLFIAYGDLASVFGTDAKAAEEAQLRIDTALSAIGESYKQQVFDQLFYQQIGAGTFDETMADTAVALGLMGQEHADYLTEVSRINELLTTATSDFRTELEQLDPEQLSEFVDIIAGGGNSIWSALDTVRSQMETDFLPKLNDEGGLYQSMDKLSEPVEAFRTVVDTEFDPIEKHFVTTTTESDNLISSVETLAERIDELPDKKIIKIKIQTSGSLPDLPGGGNVGEYQTGSWEIPTNQLAFLHAGEMVIPPGPAESIRQAAANPATAAVSPYSVSSGNVSFQIYGADNPAAVADAVERRLKDRGLIPAVTFR